MKNYLLALILALLTACGGNPDFIPDASAGNFGGEVPQSFFKVNISGSIASNGVTLISATSPVILSGFGTSPALADLNGTASFLIIVGSGGTAFNGFLTFPPGNNGWLCQITNITAQGSLPINTTYQAFSVNATTVSIASILTTTGGTTPFAAFSVLAVTCTGF